MSASAIVMAMIELIDATKKDKVEVVDRLMNLVSFLRELDPYYTKNKKRLREHLSRYFDEKVGKSDAKIVLAKIDGKIIGVATAKIKEASPFLDGKKVGWLDMAFIDKRYRSKGISTMLIDDCLAWFKRKMIRHVHLMVDARNEIAIKAWSKAGFSDFVKEMKLDL